jgi:lysozyme
MREIPDLAVDFIAEHEGRRLKSYQDSVGVWTVGWGHTGPDVHEGMTISEAKARALLKADLKTAAARLAAKVKPEVIKALTEHQYAALLSFVFNVGAGDGWTIWRRLNAQQLDQIPLELAKFVNGTVGGKKVKIQGLVNRRAAETALWSTDEPGSVPDKLSSGETRAMVTPPTPADPTPPSRSAALLTSVAAAATAGPPMVNQAMQAVQPYAEHSDAVQRIYGVLAALGAILAVAGLILMWMKIKGARS